MFKELIEAFSSCFNLPILYNFCCSCYDMIEPNYLETSCQYNMAPPFYPMIQH